MEERRVKKGREVGGEAVRINSEKIYMWEVRSNSRREWFR